MVTDPIADFASRIGNAGKAGHTQVQMPYSRLKESIAQVLVREGRVKGVSVRGGVAKKTLVLELSKAAGRESVHAQRVSKQSRRVYASARELAAARHARGTVIVSTPRGVSTAPEAAKNGVGGEILLRFS